MAKQSSRECLDWAPRILIIDDSKPIRCFLERILSEDGYLVTAAPTLQVGLFALRETCFEVVVVDLSLPDADGIEGIRYIHTEFPELKILAMSSYMSRWLDTIVKNAGATSTLQKPSGPEAIRFAAYELIDPTNAWRAARGWIR